MIFSELTPGLNLGPLSHIQGVIDMKQEVDRKVALLVLFSLIPLQIEGKCHDHRSCFFEQVYIKNEGVAQFSYTWFLLGTKHCRTEDKCQEGIYKSIQGHWISFILEKLSINVNNIHQVRNRHFQLLSHKRKFVTIYQAETGFFDQSVV